MTSMAELLNAALQQSRDSIQLRDAVVSALRDDGLNLTYQGQLVSEAAVLDSYEAKAGDVVACLVVGTRWLVLGKIGVATPKTVATTDISWSDAAPAGTGWQVSASGDVFVKDNKIHVKRVADAPDPDKPATDDAIIKPDATECYAEGRRNPYFDGRPAQGAWYRPPNTGIWVYGSKISDFVAGRTATKITMEVSRLEDGSGVYGAAAMHLYLITNGTVPSSTPSLSHAWTPGVKLGPGDALRGDDAIVIPDEQRDLLASGAYKGIGCYTSITRDYIVYGNCGNLHAWVQ
jgi:hypothetical protein